MKIDVIDNKGENTGRKIDLSNGIYKVEPNEHAVYLEVKQYLANQRQGTHKTKGRSEITGSTKKIKKQKVLVQRVQVVESQVYLEGEALCSARSPENMASI